MTAPEAPEAATSCQVATPIGDAGNISEPTSPDNDRPPGGEFVRTNSHSQPPAATNAPESEAITADDDAVFEEARQAISLLKRTFEFWLTIGRAVVKARELANRHGDGRTFMRLIEQQGLERVVDKSMASNLLRIMAKLPEVMAWRDTLTEREQIEWASPLTVIRRCPALAKPRTAPAPENNPKPTLRDRVANLSDENRDLKAHVAELEAAREAAPVEQFVRTNSVEEHVDALVELLQDQPPRAVDKIVRAFVERLKKARQQRA